MTISTFGHARAASAGLCIGSGDQPLLIENEQGKSIVGADDFHLIVKPANTCGGIADLPEPAAQLGASFLRLFGAVIFDPKTTTVWLDPAGKRANP